MPRAASVLASLRWPLPADAALHGHALDAHLRFNLDLALALLALAHVILLAGLFFRRREPETRRKTAVEYLPLTAFALLFVWLAVRANLLWAAQRYTGADPAAMQVEATGMQFAWYFRYPGRDARFGQLKPTLIEAAAGNPLGLDPADPASADDLVTSELVLPAGREVDLTLRAQDVIHGFAVPELRLKQNAVPGQAAHIHFTPDAPGAYAILCTQLCGIGHYRMQATLRVLPAADFDRWLQTREAAHR